MSDKAFQTVIVGHQCPTYTFFRRPFGFSGCLLQFGKFLFDGVFGHKAAHFVVVEQHDGGVAAGTHAFAFDEGEFAVGGGFAVADAEFFLQIFSGIDAAAQGAGEVGADGEFVFADGLEVVHVVEGGDFVGGNGGDADVVGDKFDGFGGEPAFFGLGNAQGGHDGGAAAVGGVFGQFSVDLFEGFWG